ncbi:MAG: serine hydrolase domain-containing protein [Rhizomicrobium sp.]
MELSRRSIVAGAAGLAAATAVKSKAASLDPSFAEVRAAAADTISKGATPGLMIAIAHGWRTVFREGFGSANLECFTPVVPETVFHIGSMTKQFTAAAILRLQEQGLLAVDDPLSRFIPDFPDAAAVTLRQLLTHTSGLHNFTADLFPYTMLQSQDISLAKLVAYLSKQAVEYDFEPGTAHSYSNSGFVLLGAVIEKVTGETYSTYLKREVLDRARLKSTVVDRVSDVVPHRASGYEVWGPGNFHNALFISMSIPRAAGALRSTAEDLLAWHRALFAGDVITPASLALMLEPSRLKNGDLASTNARPAPKKPPTSNYGMGLIVDELEGEKFVQHPGAINGFTADMVTFPRLGLSLAVLSNGPVADELVDQILPGVLRGAIRADGK